MILDAKGQKKQSNTNFGSYSHRKMQFCALRSKENLKKTNDFESAIKYLKPPVFWKDKDNFKLHCKKWPINETVLNFNLLVNTELSCKADYNLTNILCERALINIAVRGQKYFQ